MSPALIEVSGGRAFGPDSQVDTGRADDGNRTRIISLEG